MKDKEDIQVSGKQTMVGSGTVVTKNVSDNDLALSRTRQTNKKNFGKKMMQNQMTYGFISIMNLRAMSLLLCPVMKK